MTGWDEKMGELRRRFIERAIAHGRHLDDDPLDRGQLEDIAHRISGSAGMFGFTGLGRAAEAFEEALRNQCDDAALGRHAALLREEIGKLQAR